MVVSAAVAAANLVHVPVVLAAVAVTMAEVLVPKVMVDTANVPVPDGKVTA